MDNIITIQTNRAALIINGTTIHKFSRVCKSYDILKAMKFKYNFVDEVSMLTERFLLSFDDKEVKEGC